MKHPFFKNLKPFYIHNVWKLSKMLSETFSVIFKHCAHALTFVGVWVSNVDWVWHGDIHFSCLSLCHRMALTPSRQDKAVALKKLRKNVVTLSAIVGEMMGYFTPSLLFIKNATQTLKNEMERSLYDLKRFWGCILFFHTFDYQRILGKLCHSGKKSPKLSHLSNLTLT